MKKLIFIFALFFFLFNYHNLKAEENINMESISYSIISEYVNPLDTRVAFYRNKELGLYYFCIEPTQTFKRSDKSYNLSNYTNSNYKELGELLNAFNNIIIDKSEDEIKNYYIATQLRIWELCLNVSPTINSHDKYFFNYSDIENYINNNYKIIDLNINDYEIDYLNEKIVCLNDIDLSKYNIESNGLDIIKINNHTISITNRNFNISDYTINILPIVDYDRKIKEILNLFQSESSQDMIALIGDYPEYLKGCSFNIRCNLGNLVINKYDDSDSLIMDPIKFDLYNSNDIKILSNLTTDKGQIILNNIPCGNYYLKEQESEKYISIKDKIEFSIDSNSTTNLNIYNKSKDLATSFIKIDENDNTIDNCLFSLYELNNSGNKLEFIHINHNVNLLETFGKGLNNPRIEISERYQQYFNGTIFNSNEYGYFTYEIYDDDILVKQGKVYVIDDFELSNGSYNCIDVKLVGSLLSSEFNTFDSLKSNKKYLLIEEEPALGYEYINNPFILISTYNDDYKKINTFVNKERLYNLHLYKTSDKEILLNGALFRIEYFDNNNKHIIKDFITGESNIDGGFVIDSIPYNKPIIVQELYAPKGYIKDDNVYTIYPNIPYLNLIYKNYRINSSIIIGPYVVVKTCVE